MNSYLLFLVKSTLSFSILYLTFSVLMRKDTFFKLNRIVLLLLVLCSVAIPFLYSPQLFQPIVLAKFDSLQQNTTVVAESAPTINVQSPVQLPFSCMETGKPTTTHASTLFMFVYLSGIIISFLLLIKSMSSVLLLFRKAQKIDRDGICLMLIADEIPAFSFGRNILISKHDYDINLEAIINHELAHIRMGHFYDLILMELAKIIFWFNPLIYFMVRDLKDIHEFQADQHTLNKGIDATQYQKLIIQKGVGSLRFALANSFNHCQIKKRITMMNKSKNSKAWRWKLATFLPLLALLLMAFGKPGENAQKISPPEIVQKNQNDSSSLSIEIRKDGYFINNKLCTLEEISRRAELWQKNNKEEVLILWLAVPSSPNGLSEVKAALKKAKIKSIDIRVFYSGETIVQKVDAVPQFPGGIFALRKWIPQNIIYPNKPLIKRIEGNVYVNFSINAEGRVLDPTIVKGIDPDLDAEALRIVSQMPKWKPGLKNGKAINVNYYMPIRFALKQ